MTCRTQASPRDLLDIKPGDLCTMSDVDLAQVMNRATIRACCLGVEQGQKYRDLTAAVLKEQRSRHATQISLDQIREFSDMLEGKK